jgi:hypothetical protein
MSWAFSASCVLEGYECQSPGDSSELPGYLDTPLPPPKHYLPTRLRTSVFFPTPLKQRYSARAQPWDLDSCVQTRSCHISKVHPCGHVLNESTRAKSRGGYLCGKLRVSIYTRHVSFPNPLRQTQTPFGRYMRHLRAEAKSCMVCKGWIRGGSTGGNATQCSARV